LRVKYDKTESGLVCHVVGNLETLTVGEFREAMAEVGAHSQVVVDLSAVPFVDSAGLGALIGAVRHIRESGGDVVVCGPRPSVARVLDLVGLKRVVAIAADHKEARSLFRSAA
jgi:anti-sigma B factor antagonist